MFDGKLSDLQYPVFFFWLSVLVSLLRLPFCCCSVELKAVELKENNDFEALKLDR